MSSLRSDIDTATGIFKQVVEQVEKDRQQIEEDRKRCEEEKQKWEEEKAKIDNTYTFHGQRILLDVGGTHYSTSRSTLTKYPESMLGAMFSGRHDLETMKCSDGSFFIDRDGARFRYILDYLRDGKDIVQSFPKSTDVLLGLLYDAKYYQLDGLVTALSAVLREVDFISQDDISINFKSGSGNYKVDGVTNPPQGRQRAHSSFNMASGNCVQISGTFNQQIDSITVHSHSLQAVSYERKSMKKLSFRSIRFDHPVSFFSCNLTSTSFTECSFGSCIVFKDCILDCTSFSNVNGLVANVSFIGSKIDRTYFSDTLRAALQAAGKI
ncbi:uncharacterized protein [Dysidea avara]|uniref:uncharacterized protein n=1 Tax=Dysidea avara TaxID=196820 RepID=UPI003326041F